MSHVLYFTVNDTINPRCCGYRIQGLKSRGEKDYSYYDCICWNSLSTLIHYSLASLNHACIMCISFLSILGHPQHRDERGGRRLQLDEQGDPQQRGRIVQGQLCRHVHAGLRQDKIGSTGTASSPLNWIQHHYSFSIRESNLKRKSMHQIKT